MASLITTGRHDCFFWLVSPSLLDTLVKRTLEFHQGLRVCVTSCDSGPLAPTAEERALGWSTIGEIAVGPRICGSPDIPSDKYDEWYLFDEPPGAEWKPEVFVNYGGFTVVPVDDLVRDLHPTEDKRALDWLRPVQDRFWKQIEKAHPVSFIASGDFDVVVTQKKDFVQALLAGENA